MNFLLPDKCETCGAKTVSRSIETRYSSDGIESVEYACGARCQRYRSHERSDIKQACPKSPGELAKAARQLAIDTAVAKALNSVKATYAECELFPKRMERDRGWGLRVDEGIWPLLTAKKPRDE